MTAALYLGIACVAVLAWTAWPFWDADVSGVPETHVIRAAVAMPRLQHARLTDAVAHPVRHAGPGTATDREHRPRHTGELPVLFADRYRQHNAATTARATGSWLEETCDLSHLRRTAITGEVVAEAEDTSLRRLAPNWQDNVMGMPPVEWFRNEQVNA